VVFNNLVFKYLNIKIMKNNKLIIVLTLFFIAFTSCKDNEREAETMDTVQEENFNERLQEARGSDDIIAAVESDPELSTFATGLNAWNVQDTVREGEMEMIVFAPTNLAYSRTNQDDGGAMVEIDSEKIISYHIIETENDLAALKEEIRRANDTLEMETIQGEHLKFSLDGNSLVITGATGVSARVIDSVQAGNGMVYKIDKVLMPIDTSREVTITNEG
jgi:uncharacterized surface protein with fasciclin (FAS1) repeats